MCVSKGMILGHMSMELYVCFIGEHTIKKGLGMERFFMPRLKYSLSSRKKKNENKTCFTLK